MTYVKVPKQNAESIKRMLKKANMLDNNAQVKYNKGYAYFPIKELQHNEKEAFLEKYANKYKVQFSNMKKEKNEKINYEEGLKMLLSKEEFNELSRGYDLLGNIAIIEISDKLKQKEKKIAEILIGSNKNIETVLKKAGPVEGIYRLRKLKYLAGKRSFIANYKENHCVFMFDVRKVFFSNRLSFERSRLCNLSRDGESIMVMFAGVGPFAIEIAKAHKNAKIVAIELNKAAYEYMKKNIEINKVKNVVAVNGDVKDKCKEFEGFADRVIMPMPKTSLLFLDEACLAAKKHAFIHIYTFSPVSDPFGGIQKSLEQYAKEHDCQMSIVGKRIVRPYSANEVEIVADIEIKKEPFDYK
ncbi:MAG: class I SAM-dependent methyltransferase [Candidatus Micrarchaeia archaeon]